MKEIIALLFTVSVVPVSIIGMIWGWGLQAENWGWISFSYAWVLIAPLISAVSK